MDAYEKIYADSRKWLANGWVDYLAPQLYWPIASREQSFPALFNWWESQNPEAATSGPRSPIRRSARNFLSRKSRIRSKSSASEMIPARCIIICAASLDNPALDAAVQAIYAQPALVPASPWIAATPPLKPRLTVDTGESSAHVRWENSNGEPPRWWLLQSRANGIWTTHIFPAGLTDCYLDNGIPDAICVRAVDRLGNLSEPAVWTPKKFSPANRGEGAVNLK